MSYNKTTQLKRIDNDEDEDESEALTATNTYQSSKKVGHTLVPFQEAVSVESSRKLLLRVSLFERKRNQATVNIHHHDGQCDIIKLPDCPQASGSTFHSVSMKPDGGKKLGNPKDSLEQLYQMAENLGGEQGGITPWNNVRYQVLDTTTTGTMPACTQYAQYPNKTSSIRRKSMSKSRFSVHHIHNRKSKNSPRVSPRNVLKAKPRLLKECQRVQTDASSESSFSLASFTLDTSTSISRIRVGKTKEDISVPNRFEQKSIAVQKYHSDHHQQSVAVQFNSDHSLTIAYTHANILTVMRPTRSVGTLAEKPKPKPIEPKKDSIIDLYHALHMKDFSEKINITQSDPSLSCTYYDDYGSRHEVAALFHKYNPWPCVQVQTDDVKIIESEQLVSMKSPGYSQTSPQHTPILRITRSRLANRVFPVLSPSGEHIGSLIGQTVPKAQTHAPTSRGQWAHYSKKGYNIYNASIKHSGFPAFCASKIKAPGSPYLMSCRGLTKNFHKPVVIPSTKQMTSVGLQVDCYCNSPRVIEASSRKRATPTVSFAGRKPLLGQWRTPPHRTMLRSAQTSRYGKKVPFGSVVSTLMATINLEEEDECVSVSRSHLDLLPLRYPCLSKNKSKPYGKEKVREVATITSATQGIKARIDTGDLIEL